MNRVVARTERLETTLALAEKRAATASVRSKWQTESIVNLRALAALCATKRQRHQKPTDDEAAAETVLYERSFRDFVPAAWPVAVQGQSLTWWWHLDAIADCLQALVKGEIRKLLISCPPRSLKSTLLSVMLTAWVWTHDPAFRTVHASMKSELATRDSTACRRVLESQWYRSRWTVKLRDDQDTKSRFENVLGGHRIAIGTGGATGDGGDLVGLDDPHDIESANSEADIEAVKSWFTSTLLSRLDHPATGRVVVAGQRIDKNDLIGHLLEVGGYEHLCLPLEFVPARKSLIVLPSGVIEDRRTVLGESLCPARWSEKTIAEYKAERGAALYDSLYQQAPHLHGGSAAFVEFDPKVHVQPCPYDPSLPICWSMDFNVNPFCNLLLQHKDGVVRVFYELDIPDIRTSIACETLVALALENKWDLKGLLVYGDASGSQQRTSASQSDWAIVTDRMRDWLAPLSIRHPAANPLIKDTVNAVHGKLLAADGTVGLLIDPQCKRLIRDLQKAVWPSTMEECHSLAALRYFCHWEYPVSYFNRSAPTSNVFTSISID